jgi:hypothetical protein
MVRFPISMCVLAGLAHGAPQFTASADTVEAYDFIEVTVRTRAPATNPFTTAELTGELHGPGGGPLRVTGFCDSRDGSVFRIRFLATRPGEYRYTVEFRSPEEKGRWEGAFRAAPGRRRGLVRVDPDYPNHFIWEGTGEHYFWNGLTTYALMGWQDESSIRAIIERAARLKVNRLRVSLNGPRVTDATRWYEPVVPSEKFRFLFGAWEAPRPDNVTNPGWDVGRYDVAYWQKYERMLRHAREHDVVVSVIFFLDGRDPGADPFGKARMFGEEERAYYRYAAARLAAYSNVMWDVTNEWHLFRNAWWVERMGTYLKSVDPYRHLASCHGHGEFPWMLSGWPDFAMFQIWDEEGGYEPMLKRRTAQTATGRPMPQVNEEYGYEDHYPVKWGGNRRPPARSADNRRRLAWQISMAGCYQTTGERANRGDGNPPPTPGGWLNGGFDDSMRMLEGYARMVDFFTAFEYWKLEPVPPRAGGPLVLAEPGRRYVLYYPGRAVGEVTLEPGAYRLRWFNPRVGSWTEAPSVVVPSKQAWSAPQPPDAEDWALLIERAPAP